MSVDKGLKISAIGITALWLLCFALVPLLLLVGMSLMTSDPDTLVKWPLTFKNYFQIFQPGVLHVIGRSFTLASLVTFIAFLLAYPFCWLVSQLKNERLRNWLMILVIVPLWTSTLIRSYALIAILKAKGLLNGLLLSLGLIHTPLQLLYNNVAVVVGLVYNLLPFMILPIYTQMQAMDQHYIEAARDLGANGWQIFIKVMLPLTFTGIVTGAILVFFPAITLFYIPDILGGAKSLLFGNLITQTFLEIQDWPLGAALSVLLILLVGVVLLLQWQLRVGKGRAHQDWL